MSFDKDYPNRKDWRKPYRGSKAFDRSCRPGGDCPWCEGNRRIRDLRHPAAPADKSFIINALDTAAPRGEENKELTDAPDDSDWLRQACRAIEIDREVDGRWIAEVPTLPGVMAYGRTREEAVNRVLALAEIVADTAQLRRDALDDRGACRTPDPVCQLCGGEGIIMTAPAGAAHEDDLAEYCPCDCRIEAQRQANIAALKASLPKLTPDPRRGKLRE